MKRSATTRLQRKGNVATVAKSRVRLEQLRQHSAAGRSKADAAERIGLTVHSVNAILKRLEGATTWPMAE